MLDWVTVRNQQVNSHDVPLPEKGTFSFHSSLCTDVHMPGLSAVMYGFIAADVMVLGSWREEREERYGEIMI